MRAVLGHDSGSSLRLPQTKSPSTVARRVIHFEPESHWQGSGSVVLGVGVGHGNWLLHCWACTPPGEIRHQSQEYKHTSLSGSPNDRTDILIAELQDQMRSLEKANRENRRIIAALTSHIPAIVASQEAPEAS
jgi:hypothetical protein